MKLYTKPGACSTAGHIALHWTGQPFDVEVVTQKQVKEAGYLAMNPAGTVPVLMHGDFMLTQNAAILGYLHDSYPQAGLGGDGSAHQRAEASRWLSFCNADLHPAFTPLFAPGLFMTGSEHYEAVRVAAKRRIRRLYETVDTRLGESGGWLAGFRSFADPYLFVTMGWAKKLGIDLSGLPNLQAFDACMAADPGVQAALRTEGLID